MIVGIDPGLNGGIAFLYKNRVHARPMPTLKTTKSKRQVDENRLALLLRTRSSQIDHVFVEKVNAMPGQGVTSMFNFGAGYGIVRGICVGLQLPYTLVHPATWKKAICAGENREGKDASIIVAHRLWPKVDLRASPRSKKDHDGMADALCIAEWGRRTHAL